MNRLIPPSLRWSNLTQTLIALLGILLLSLIDYATGHELSFALFYLLPVSFIAWYMDKRPALLLAVLSVVAWHAANDFAGQVFSHPLIPFWNDLIRLGFFTIVILLLARLRELLAHEQALAQQDFLTGLYNARALYTRADAEVAQRLNADHPLSVLYLDLDCFKSVNDQHGHNTGDLVLVEVAQILEKSVRMTDLVARIGGDEFVVLLPNTDATVAREIVDRIRHRFLAEMQNNGWPVTFSAGLITCLCAPDTVDQLIRMADDLMYWAKDEGKNNTRSFIFTAEHRLPW